MAPATAAPVNARIAVGLSPCHSNHQTLGEGVGEAVGGVGQGVGEAAGGLGQGLGGAEALAGALAGDGQSGGGSVGELAEGAGALGVSAGDIAKLATKLAAQELRSAASKEAKGLRVAAARKAQELNERRRERTAESVNATPTAVSAANELEVDLEDVDGSGADGRITVANVRKAARGQ